MKKFCSLVVLLVIGTILFAQNISITGELTTDFDGVSPLFGLEVHLSKIDILAGFGFWFYENEVTYDNYQTFDTDYDSKQNIFKIFSGVAPKILINEKILLSFPLLAEIQFGNDFLEYNRSTVYSPGSLKKAEYFGYGFDAGARIYFSLTKRWSIYTGAIAQILYISNNKYTYWKNSPNDTYTRKNNGIYWFTNGDVELGVRFTF
jgi:hypothetical protein